MTKTTPKPAAPAKRNPLWPTAGASADVVLNRLYFDVIPFVPSDERKSRDFIALDNAAVRRMVDDELKKIAGMSFERFSSGEHKAVVDQQSGSAHWLEFNLEPSGAAGSVISAVYKTPDRVELNFLRASRDLATYARLRQLTGQLAIFVMSPSPDSMPPPDFERIENVVGEQSWSLAQQGFLVSAHSAAHPLAQHVWAWAEPSIPKI